MQTAMHGCRMWLRLLGECDVGTPSDGSTEVLVGSTAWTNKALCVFKRKSALPYYQFQKWFSSNDISDKHSTLVSALMRETAALNSSNLCIPIFMDVSATSPGAAWPSVLLLACNHPSLGRFHHSWNILLLDRKWGCITSTLQELSDQPTNGNFSKSRLHLTPVTQK